MGKDASPKGRLLLQHMYMYTWRSCHLYHRPWPPCTCTQRYVSARLQGTLGSCAQSSWDLLETVPWQLQLTTDLDATLARDPGSSPEHSAACSWTRFWTNMHPQLDASSWMNSKTLSMHDIHAHISPYLIIYLAPYYVQIWQYMDPYILSYTILVDVVTGFWLSMRS